MSIPAFDPATGRLPPGRYLCTLAEVEQQFVASPWATGCARRQQVWSDFHDSTGLYRDIEPNLPTAVWIAGSFTTQKPDPDDIDLAYLLDGDVYEGLSKNAKRKVDRLSARDGQECHLRLKTGLLVDCFAFVVRKVPLPWVRLSPDEETYFKTRGMWDDWWERCSTGAKGAMPTLADAESVRGYLEVRL